MRPYILGLPNRRVGAQHAVPARARPKCECIYEMEYLAVRDVSYLVLRPGGSEL